MAYLGTPIDTTNQFQSLQGKRFSGDASTTAFTLDVAPSSTLDIEVFVENVRQDPNSAYSLSGTTLTFSAAPPSGTNNIYVVHQAKAVGTIDPPATESVAKTFTSGVTSSTTDNSDNLTLISTDDDANSGPNLRLYRNSSSPGDSDVLGQIDFEGRNDNSEDIVSARIQAITQDVTDGTEDGRLTINTIMDGTERIRINCHSGGITFRNDDEKMRIDSDGDVGIGTTSPEKRLHIKDTGSVNAKHVVLRVENADTGDSASGLEFITNRGSTAGSTKIYGAPEDGSGTASLQFIGANHFFRNQADSSNYLAINSNGRITRHQSTTSGHLNLLGEVGSSSKAIVFAHVGNGSEVGSITTGSSSTAYNTSSDYRLKENVDYNFDATTRLKQLKPARFNFITDETNTLVDGFLAHEVSSVVPEAITGTHNEVQVWEEGEELPEGVSVGDNKLDDKGNTIPVYQGIDQSKLVPLLVKTIQELEARITALEE